MNKSLLVLLLSLIFFAQIVHAAPPAISDINPADGTENISIEGVQLTFNVTDEDGDLSHIKVESNKTGTWDTLFESGTGGNWSGYCTMNDLEYGSTYYWRIRARDDAGNWTNTTSLSFITELNETEEDDEDDEEDADIEIVPSEPQSGKTILFLADTTQSGYVYCYETENVYPFTMENGMGSISLKNEYGLARVTILGYGSLDFEIQSSFEGNIVIDAPSNIQVDNVIPIRVISNGELISADLHIETPSGKTVERTINNETFDYEVTEVGEYIVTAEAYNTEQNKTIYVEPKPLNIQISDGEIIAGKEMEVRVNDGCTVTFTKEEASWTYESDDAGYVYFTPPWSGRYKLTAESDGQHGSKYFTAIDELTISIKNEEGLPVSKVSKENVYMIQVTNIGGEPVNIDSVDLYADGMYLKQLNLVAGSTLWKPETDATSYTIEYQPDDNNYLPSSISLSGEGTVSEEGINTVYLGILIAIILIGGAIYYAYTQGWINPEIFSSLKDILPVEKESSEMDDIL